MAFRLIFALYILSLAIMPCADGYTDAGSSTVVVATSPSGHHEQDLCAPFCICTCCASPIQLNYLAEVRCSLYQYNPKFITLYVIDPVVDQTASIWQPPRIS
jgi:hypothetical protein